MKKEIEKLLAKTNWQIDRVKTTCERIEQIRREYVIYKSYKHELEGILEEDILKEEGE